MAPVKLIIKGRISEVTTLGNFVVGAVNQTEFATYQPSEYTSQFFTDYNNNSAEIDSIINPQKITAELKVITQRIYTSQFTLREKINFLEGYISKATGLTINPKDFGISKVRKANNIGDIEGLTSALNYLLDNVTTNLVAIQAKGYTDQQHSDLLEINQNFKNDNLAQNNKINERNNKVVENYALINAFWLKITDLCKTGKILYKYAAPNKLDDFTISKLIKRINQERTNTLIQGTISSGTTPIANAKVQLIPLFQGRKRSIKTKANGSFSIASLEKGEYTLKIDVAGKDPYTEFVTINIGQPLLKNISLP